MGMDKCEKDCDKDCGYEILDMVRDVGPKVDCTDKKFTPDYIKHEAEECLEALVKALKENNDSFACEDSDIEQMLEEEGDVSDLVCEEDDPAQTGESSGGGR